MEGGWLAVRCDSRESCMALARIIAADADLAGKGVVIALDSPALGPVEQQAAAWAHADVPDTLIVLLHGDEEVPTDHVARHALRYVPGLIATLVVDPPGSLGAWQRLLALDAPRVDRFVPFLPRETKQFLDIALAAVADPGRFLPALRKTLAPSLFGDSVQATLVFEPFLQFLEDPSTAAAIAAIREVDFALSQQRDLTPGAAASGDWKAHWHWPSTGLYMVADNATTIVSGSEQVFFQMGGGLGDIAQDVLEALALGRGARPAGAQRTAHSPQVGKDFDELVEKYKGADFDPSCPLDAKNMGWEVHVQGALLKLLES